jgi:hypothetical protein
LASKNIFCLFYVFASAIKYFRLPKLFNLLVQKKLTTSIPDDKIESDIYTICKIECGFRRFDDKKPSKKHTIKNKDLSRVNILDIIVNSQNLKQKPIEDVSKTY